MSDAKPGKINCWEHWGCGFEPGGPRAAKAGPCLAATETTCDGINSGRNAGRLCWALRETLCRTNAFAMPARGVYNCEECSFYRRVKYEEGCHFQSIKLGLGILDPDILHRHLNDVMTLLTISRDVFACLAVHPLVVRVTEHACATTQSLAAGTYLVDSAKNGELVLEARAGSMRLAERVRKHDHSPVAEAMRTRRIYRTTRAVADRSEPASVVAMPIAGDEEPAGVLELLKIDGQFSQDDEWFLQQISLIAGLGIGNAKLVDSMGQLKRFDKAKSRFVALLMHQISSPLATIACSLEALRQVDDKLSKDKRRKLMHYSMDRINSIQTLSRNLLNLASIRAGTSLMQVRPVSAAEILRNEVEARAEQAREKGVEMAMQGNDAGTLVLADPDGLQVIFSNLLDNAIKYSVGPVKKVEAEVEVAQGDAFVCVRVRDKGIGIPPEEQSAVFEEFHRASNVSRSQVSGSGIGLATVRELVERYNGRISLESVLGTGTTVSVEFPVVVDTSCENESVE